MPIYPQFLGSKIKTAAGLQIKKNHSALNAMGLCKLIIWRLCYEIWVLRLTHGFNKGIQHILSYP